MGHLHILRQRFGIDGKTVVLRRDFDFAGLEKLHGMIGTAMAELQLEGLASQRKPENLVAETDAEYRLIRLREIAHVLDRVSDGGRITGTIAEKDAVDIGLQQLLRRS